MSIKDKLLSSGIRNTKSLNARFISTGLLVTAILLGCGNAAAQFQPTWQSGKGVAPAFEGWVLNSDGSYTMLFGYMSDNWEAAIYVPIGSENSFSPGAGDRGQPTHFLPRRNRNSFGVEVPEDFEGELVWTLITEGGITQKAYGSLRRDYVLEPITIMSESGTVAGGASNSEDVQVNLPPTIRLVGDKIRTVRVGQQVELEVEIEDDGNPKLRMSPGTFREDDAPRQRLAKALRPPIRGFVDRVVASTFSWFVYRGDGEASFEPLQAKTWEDTRAFQNSPWSPYWVPPEMPEDGKIHTKVSFYQQGEYVLRGRADDGGLVAEINVTIRVTE